MFKCFHLREKSVSDLNQMELVWFCGSDNSWAFSLKLADATRFIFGTKSDEQP